jgi:hypothetical protein
MPEYRVGITIKANRDIPKKGIKKHDYGTITHIEVLDSETYFHITMSDGKCIGPSCENCWSLL